jgi:MFS family permease
LNLEAEMLSADSADPRPRHPLASATIVDPPPSERDAARTLLIAGAGTFLVLATFASAVSTVGLTAADLHTGLSGETWALSAISLGLASALLSAGVLADAYGRRRVFVLSSAALATASVLGAVAWNIEIFVFARVLQGIAGAGLLASSLGIIGHTFPSGSPRTRATGIWGAMVGGGIALGPAASAALALLWSWRASYWVGAGAAALLLPGARGLLDSRAGTRQRVDWRGALLLAGATTCTTAALTAGRMGWTRSLTLVLLAVGALLLALFVLLERSVKAPMLDLGLFGNPLFVASIAGALFTGLALIALMSFLPTLLEHGYRHSALASAAILGIWSGASMLAAFQARRLPGRLDSSHRLAIGFLMCAIGLATLGALQLHSSWLKLAPGLLLAGIGSGIANAALGRLAVESVSRERTGMGAGANNTARYTGGAAGIAMVVALVSAGNKHSGPAGLIEGWNLAAAVAALLCLLAAAVALLCSRLSAKTSEDSSTRSSAERQRA